MRVIIIAYTFPPNNVVAAMRPVRIARAFLARGWEVTVIHARDLELPSGLSTDITGFTTKSYRPSALSRMLTRKRSPLASKAVNALRRLAIPDHTWLLQKPARKALAAELAAATPDAIVTISFPFSLHTLGAETKRRLPKTVWVADNRDMWAGNPFRKNILSPRFLERRIERSIFEQCDIASFTAPSALAAYEERFPQMRFPLLVMNGAEPMPPTPGGSTVPGLPLRIVHIGSLYNGQRDLAPLLSAVREAGIDEKAVELHLIGPDAEGEGERLQKLSPIAITARGLVDRATARELQAGAGMLVVCMGDTEYDRTFVPAKIFEYASTGRPIIALVHPQSDLANIIQEHKLGIASFDPKTIGAFISDVLHRRWQTGGGSAEQLTADFQFGKLVAAVEKLVDRNSKQLAG